MEVEIPALKMLEKVISHSEDALTDKLLQLQEAQIDKMSALDYYTKIQDWALEKINKKIKEKGISKGDLVLRYNSKLDNTFQKSFKLSRKAPSR